MAGRSGKGLLGDVKGGGLLAGLRGKLAPHPRPKSARPQPATAEELAAALARRSRPAPSAAKRSEAALEPKTNGKPKKEQIKLPRWASEAALAPLCVVVPSRVATAFEGFFQRREAAFRRLGAMRPTLDAFTATHGGASQIKPEVATEVARLVAVGAAESARMVDREDGYFIGHDFGTSTTKTVLRHPYRRGSAFALAVPPGLAEDGGPHLWPSAVFLDGTTGRLSLHPAVGFKALAGFKSALIEKRSHRICAGSGATMAEAATAFLALHLAFVLGALKARDRSARVAGVNMGVPVAALADANACVEFRRVVRAALLLVERAADLTLDDVRVALALDEHGPIPFELHTELSGAIAGYCRQPRKHAGAHMIVDCGSATLDIAGFHLSDGQQWPVGIHAASVERLGADACAAYRTAGARLEECRDASHHQENVVYRQALDRHPAGFARSEDNRYPYQVVLIGGGMAGEVHGPLFEKMQQGFNLSFHRPGVANDLDLDSDADPARLILADGLARDLIDVPEVLMPRDRPQASRLAEPEMITKDQV